MKTSNRLSGGPAGSATPETEMARPDILTYHKIGSQFEVGITSVSAARFRQHLELLIATGKRFVTAGHMVAGGLNGNAVALTFDDGYESVYTEVLPEMQERGITGTVFPVVGAIGSDNRWDIRLSFKRFRHVTGGQLAELARSGFEVGSHTMSHRDLTRLSATALMRELRVSKRVLEDRLGVEVKSIAFPFGRFNTRVIGAAMAAGYTCGFASAPNDSGSVMTVGRMGVHAMDGVAALARKLGLRPGLRFEVMKGKAIANLALITTLLKR